MSNKESLLQWFLRQVFSFFAQALCAIPIAGQEGPAFALSGKPENVLAKFVRFRVIMICVLCYGVNYEKNNFNMFYQSLLFDWFAHVPFLWPGFFAKKAAAVPLLLPVCNLYV